MESHRFQAMLKRCRRKSCPCGPSSCELIRELLSDKTQATSQLKSIEWQLLQANRQPATVRHDWEKPEKPDGDYRLTVYNDGEGWSLHWFSETESNDYIEVTGEAAWPFIENEATDYDWECLGVEVV